MKTYIELLQKIVMSSSSNENLLKKKVSRRKALSTGAKIGVAAGISLAVGFIGGWFTRESFVPQPTYTSTVTKTVTSSAPMTTITKTVTLTPSPTPGIDYYYDPSLKGTT